MSKLKPLPKSKFATNKNVSLAEFYSKRKRILLMRDTGGLGDILMMRMLFEDFKNQNPGCELVVAAPLQYHSALKDHPYIDELIDSRQVDLTQFIISYNISTACGKYEKRIAPFADKHRSDIWAAHCGITLKNHNMHFVVKPEVESRCSEVLQKYRVDKGPLVIFSPVSAIHSKDLDESQSNGIINGLQSKGCNVLCLHKHKLNNIKAPTIIAENFIDFIGFIKASDYIVSVDTSTFHAAGGLGKPVVGIFSWADGMVYGKYYPKFVLVQRHRNNGNWSCGPCYLWHTCPKDLKSNRKPCITSITAEEVVQATEQLMKAWPHVR